MAGRSELLTPEAAMISRIGCGMICLFLLSGCYTQIRSPNARKEHKAEVRVPPTPVSVQRFEYYNLNVPYDYCDPFRSRTVPIYLSCLPRTRTRYPYWWRDRLVWEYSSWATVYDPWWRGCPPRVVVPRVIYASVPRDTDRGELAGRMERVTPRPNPRRNGIEGVPPPPPANRTQRPTTTRTSNPPKGNSGSAKTQPQPKKKDDEEEKREEKRAERRKRGGMR